MASLSEEERLKRLYKLQQMELRIEAPSNFASFLKYSIPKYQLKWFHKVIADHCQMLYEGKIKNLMVFIPPQFGKSEIVSRNFPAWALGRNPELKIVGCSYSAMLSNGFSTSIQRTIESEKYQSIFHNTRLNGMNHNYVRGYKRNEDYFDIVGHRGFYKSVGVGGSLTGTPADIAIIDDPIKDAMEAYSQKVRESIWAWYTSVLMTRLHNDSKQLFIMTRWHEDDLAGRILAHEANDWVVLKIPAIRETLSDGNDFDPRKVGESLWPERHSLDRLIAAKKRHPTVFTALFQQSPTIEGGNIIREAWFKSISAEDFKRMRRNKEREYPIHFFIDTAFTEKTTNDPTGIIGNG